MKKILYTLLLLIAFTINCTAQESSSSEKFGKTLNAGLGIGYYGYVGHALPVVMLNYEFDVARNFTLAPFVGVYSYQDRYYWENPKKPQGDPTYRYYTYRETVIPIGVKGTYYFDQLFKASSKWDFYAAASLGAVYRKVSWESGYYGDQYAYHKRPSPLYLDAHIGSEYHMSKKVGLFLDLSTGLSTFGFAFHM